MLLRRIEELRLAIKSGAPTPTLTEYLRLFCTGFCSALTDHHTAEDDSLFARVLARRPDLNPIVVKLMEDHALLDTLSDATVPIAEILGFERE